MWSKKARGPRPKLKKQRSEPTQDKEMEWTKIKENGKKDSLHGREEVIHGAKFMAQFFKKFTNDLTESKKFADQSVL